MNTGNVKNKMLIAKMDFYTNIMCTKYIWLWLIVYFDFGPSYMRSCKWQPQYT